MKILTRKIYQKIFFLKMSYKNSSVKFDGFLDKMAHLFIHKMEALRSESVNTREHLPNNKRHVIFNVLKVLCLETIKQICSLWKMNNFCNWILSKLLVHAKNLINPWIKMHSIKIIKSHNKFKHREASC